MVHIPTLNKIFHFQFNHRQINNNDILQKNYLKFLYQPNQKQFFNQHIVQFIFSKNPKLNLINLIINLKSIMRPKTIIKVKFSLISRIQIFYLCSFIIHINNKFGLKINFSLIKRSNSDCNFYAHFINYFIYKIYQ